MALASVDLALPWDHFLGKLGTGVANHIDAFRRTIWPQIRRDLSANYNWRVPDGLEPHWIEPGKAILWHQQQVRKVVGQAEGRRWEEATDGKWSPTPVPLGNASQLAHYLKKGFRLRPPYNGVDAMYSESAVPPEAQAAAAPEPVFWCRRHSKGPVGFSNWKAYIGHCRMNNESPEEKPPDVVVEHGIQWNFYCVVHNYGTNSPRMAERHRKEEMRRPARRTHISLDSMRIHKDKVRAR